MIPFIGFAPDVDPTTPGVITACENLIPTLKSYKGGYSGVDVGLDALSAAAISSSALVKLDASNRLIVGTTTKLYEKSGTGWADVSGSVYSASDSFPWHFAQFGDTTLAANKANTLQSSNAGAFADVAGAPKAGAICTVNGFVMVANTNDATYGDSPDRWRCCALNDATDWAPAIATQATTGRLVDTAGSIRGLKTLGYDVVAYKERSMYLGRYAGPPSVWQWTLIPGDIGCSAQFGIVNIGTAHVFVGWEDFYLFDGSRPVSIGSPLREWFFGDLDANYRYLIRGLHDRAHSLVYFYYPRFGSGGTLNGCIVYNHKSNKWGLAHRSIESAVEYITGGYTWDTLPITTWDSWPAVSYDSPFWTAASETPAYIGTDHKVYSLTGTSATSSLTTFDAGDDQMFSLLSRVRFRYLDAPTSATLTNYYQDEHGGAWTTDATTTESSGRFDMLRSARWHKAKADFVGDVEIAGVDAVLQPDGEE